jgi:hypothetical protein
MFFIYFSINFLIKKFFDSYGRSELKTSDHRPVFGIYELNSLKFDFDKAEPVLRDIILFVFFY